MNTCNISQFLPIQRNDGLSYFLLVAKRVIRILRRRKTATVGQEGEDLSSSSVDVVDGVNGAEVVDTGVELYNRLSISAPKASLEAALSYANLVHDGDAGVLGLLVKLHHGRRHVAGGDDILLVANGRLDDGSVERVRDQADDDVVLGNGGIEGLFVVDVERDGRGQLDALGELLCAFERSAGWGLIS